MSDLQPPFGPERIDFDQHAGPEEIDAWRANPGLKVLQTASPVPPHVWEQLNEGLLKDRPDVELRVYGFYHQVCDLSFLRLVPNVRRLSLDCLQSATGAEHIAATPHLEKLSVGILSLTNFDFLEALDAGDLKDLSLQATNSKKIKLGSIGRFTALERLYLGGQQRDIETIAGLTRLGDLTLGSVTLDSLDFLQGLPNLWSLDIKLGGTTNLDGLRNLKRVKYLELWQIKGLSDLSPISEMTGLQYLFLQALRNVTELPDCSRLTSLRKVHLETMKGLSDLSPLETALNLEELEHFAAKGFTPAHYSGLIAKGTMKRMVVSAGSSRVDEELKKAFTEAGIAPGPLKPFVFI